MFGWRKRYEYGIRTGIAAACQRFLIGGADAAESGRVAVGAVFADAGGIGLLNKGFVGGRRDAEGLPAAHGRVVW